MIAILLEAGEDILLGASPRFISTEEYKTLDIVESGTFAAPPRFISPEDFTPDETYPVLKTGLVEHPEDFTPDESFTLTEASWGEVAKAIPQLAGQGFKQAVAGLLRYAPDNTDVWARLTRNTAQRLILPAQRLIPGGI